MRLLAMHSNKIKKNNKILIGKESWVKINSVQTIPQKVEKNGTKED
jgi:hypothetical protein